MAMAVAVIAVAVIAVAAVAATAVIAVAAAVAAAAAAASRPTSSRATGCAQAARPTTLPTGQHASAAQAPKLSYMCNEQVYESSCDPDFVREVPPLALVQLSMGRTICKNLNNVFAESSKRPSSAYGIFLSLL